MNLLIGDDYVHLDVFIHSLNFDNLVKDYIIVYLFMRRQETQIESEDLFRQNLGQGSSGQVYYEVIDGVKYAVK